ncbi:TPA: BCCT family transporter [Staphylococcus pseudintermedius]
MTFIVFLSLFLIFSLIGKLCLGKPDEPEFKTISWLAMLFSTGDGSLFLRDHRTDDTRFNATECET